MFTAGKELEANCPSADVSTAHAHVGRNSSKAPTPATLGTDPEHMTLREGTRHERPHGV